MKTYLRALETIESSGVKAWLVGDPVRKVVMGIYPSNLNIVVEPCDLEALAVSLGEGVVGRTDFPVLRTSLLGHKVEVSCIRGPTIEEDLAKRDFTMNAIAIRGNDSFVDPFNGRHDIRNSLIRLTNDDVDLLKDDPIRIVRMLRFAAELDMDIFWKSESSVRAFVTSSAEQIGKTPAERWGREILNGMRRRPYDFIYLCDRYRLLPLFLNALEELKKIKINGEETTLFDHTLKMLSIAQDFLGARKRRENDMAFSLAMLFHHVGSEAGQFTDSNKAAEIATWNLKAWNVPSETIETVRAIVKNYRQNYVAKTEEQLCKDVLKYGSEAVEMILDFAICNSEADGQKNMEVLAANKWKLGEVIRRFDEARRRANGNQRYLSGDEVMKILDIKPGKVIGEILNDLGIAVGTGFVASKQEATDWIQKHGAAAGVRQ
ncbi:MAG: hypothetical protein LBJ36_07250 [Synergistaceae bacterium]|jgi:tRNA nucleotidyltransferase/poly(A) polymerase|nr:hypothetical protein [Synergistaceae bacterium]